MTTTTQAARPFTRQDWYGFAGAESWPAGSYPAGTPLSHLQDDRPVPVLREVNDWLLVADRNGVGAYRTGPSPAGGDADETYYLALVLPSQAVALALLDGLAADFHPARYGFACGAG